MENTIEEKERFFASHLGCEVEYKTQTGSMRGILTGVTENSYHVKNKSQVKYIDHELVTILPKPLADITEEHAIEAIMLSLGKSALEFEGKPHEAVSFYKFNGSCGLTSIEADFLRKNSYAVPFDGKSVEELIKLGWVKIRKS